MREHALGLTMGHPPPSRAPGRGEKLVPDPASSTGTQGRNVPFGEDIVESAIRSTVSVANVCPTVLPPLETVSIDGS